jgi:hypothetical protein
VRASKLLQFCSMKKCGCHCRLLGTCIRVIKPWLVSLCIKAWWHGSNFATFWKVALSWSCFLLLQKCTREGIHFMLCSNLQWSCRLEIYDVISMMNLWHDSIRCLIRVKVIDVSLKQLNSHNFFLPFDARDDLVGPEVTTIYNLAIEGIKLKWTLDYQPRVFLLSFKLWVLDT